MNQLLEGKVALITGAARGQGRSHASRLAAEGAKVICTDICADIDSLSYAMATKDDLQQTVSGIRTNGGVALAMQADVRDPQALRAAVAAGVEAFGPIDIVVANAGVSSVGESGPDDAQLFRDVVDVNLTGTWNTVHVTAPGMIERGRGGAIVLISSTLGLSGRGGNGIPGMDAYCASKHGVVGLMRTFANWLAPHSVRVNSIHPTGVETDMITNPAARAFLAAHPEFGIAQANLLPVPMIEERDVSSAVAWLVSDEARYVTGVTLPVDGGFLAK